ncbi:MAG: aminodeoxychorismate synthase component I [Azonexus sp.]|nr:aminodeoxychorismate synthase component I [Azonexus sp.]MCK6411872.1 aminodeoxychorismate synthase component I [Azonexus sp.]
MIAFFEDRRAPVGEPAAWLFERLLVSDEIRDAASLAIALDGVAQAGGWSVLALDYELGYLLEPHAAPLGWQPPSAAAAPLGRVWRFASARCLSADEAASWLAEQLDGRPVAGLGGWQPQIAEKDYLSTVDRVKDWISAGDCYQVNLTFPVTGTVYGSPLALYARLRQRQPVRYGGFVGELAGGGVGSEAIISLSPELFIEKRGRRLLTRPMKGTAARHLPPETLRDSVKDRAENLMIVDLLRNDLGRVAAAGSVRVERLFEVEAYPSVWQMVSEISAELAPGGEDLGEEFATLLRAVFPCGSITGAPKIRAMQIAGELEAAPRGLYTGALGWRSPADDLRLNVAIRTLAVGADRQARLGLGSGIVADSDPAAEWRECLLKGAFVHAADPGLRLIETLRLSTGNYPALAGHLARLAGSAAWFGFACELPAVVATLRELAADKAIGDWRVRLTLGKDGRPEVAAFPLLPEAEGPRRAWLAAETIDADDPLRRHKTTERGLYDAALQRIAGDPALFDVVFLNQRGELAEGARSNLFVERDGILLTPPLRSGALPGVLRGELLASGRAREAVLYPADLRDGFWLGNALRGLHRISTLEAEPGSLV